MPIFKRKGENTYSYRFQHNGRRFSGQTNLTDRRAAERFEQDTLKNVESNTIDPNDDLTFNAAASRYWLEHGQYKANPKDLFRQIAWLEKRIGKHRLITSIDNSLIALLVAERRGEVVRGKSLSNAAVNRSVTNPLRRILGRAHRVWGKPVPNINWPAHILPEPKERVREATPDEQEAIFENIRPDYAPALAFAFLTACRLAEIVDLKWNQINWFAQEFTVTGKGDVSRTIPMSAAVQSLLWELKDHHSESVFTYVASRTRDDRIQGNRYPVTYNGLKTAWRRSRSKSGVKDFRFHDMRHTAATRLLRATGNLRLAQRLLGHSDIQTTTKYAHVTNDDLRDGLDKVDGLAARNGTKNGTNTTTKGITSGNIKEN